MSICHSNCWVAGWCTYWEYISCHVMSCHKSLPRQVILGQEPLSCQYVILMVRKLYDIGIANIYLLSCHVILVYPDRTQWGKNMLHLSCQYVILITRRLYGKNLLEMYVLSCLVILVYPETTYWAKVILHLSCQYVVLIVKRSMT